MACILWLEHQGNRAGGCHSRLQSGHGMRAISSSRSASNARGNYWRSSSLTGFKRVGPACRPRPSPRSSTGAGACIPRLQPRAPLPADPRPPPLPGLPGRAPASCGRAPRPQQRVPPRGRRGRRARGPRGLRRGGAVAQAAQAHAPSRAQL
jgi:hypothetical protein